MPDATHSRAIESLAEPLSEDMRGLVRKSLQDIVRDMRAAEESEKRAPYERFIDGAQRAGFTDSQAEFLWSIRHRPEPRF